MNAADELIEFEAPVSLAGERIDRVVSLMAGCARKEASLLIRGGSVFLNSAIPKTISARVASGDLIQINLPVLKDELPEPDPKVEFEVVYECPDFLVINKPKGLVVHPGAGNLNGTLVNGLLARYPEISKIQGKNTNQDTEDQNKVRPGIVHRLDKETSGLMLAARTSLAYEIFTNALANREIIREYEAVCQGKMQKKRGTIEAPIGRSIKIRTKMAVKKDGKEARTHYEVVGHFKDTTHLRCRLESGRTHQIRVHLAAIGHPVLCDEVYGGNAYGDSQFKEQNFTNLALYARYLEFEYPSDTDIEEGSAEGSLEKSAGSLKKWKFLANPPVEFTRLLKYLEVGKTIMDEQQDG